MIEFGRSIERFEPVAPGSKRDIARRTDLAVDSPFFHDEAAALAFIEAGIAPLLPSFPDRCVVADLGGGDGFLADRIRSFLHSQARDPDITVVDSNIGWLMEAQERRLAVCPANLESIKLRPAHLLTMRLVNHYNGIPRQQAILARAQSNLLPEGYLVVQAEVGTWAQCAFRSLIYGLLDRGAATQPSGERCRWLPADALCRMMQRAGLLLVTANPCLMKFSSNLRQLLRLAWVRVVGRSADKKGCHAFIESAIGIAKSYGPDRAEIGISVQEDGEVWFDTCHALLVARRI